MQVENHSIPTADGRAISATLHRPENPNEKVVLINGALGAPQTYYQAFAGYLRQQGFTVLTWDYYGMGASKADNIRKVKLSLYDWGAVDQTAVIAWLKQQYSGYDLQVVGHSLGGQIVGLSEHAPDVTALMGVAAQSGYWGNWSGMSKLRMLWLWYLGIPLTTTLMGYFPAGWFGMGEPQPRNVAKSWASAGRQPNYLIDEFGALDHDHYAEFKGAFVSLCFADDPLAPPKAVQALLDFYPNSQFIDYEYITPADAGNQPIGHFGFFKQAMQDTLWFTAADWLSNPRPPVEAGEHDRV